MTTPAHLEEAMGQTNVIIASAERHSELIGMQERTIYSNLAVAYAVREASIRVELALSNEAYNLQNLFSP